MIYDTGNNNGKISTRCYIDQILEPIIKQWVKKVKQGKLAAFTLKEGRDGAYGVSLNSPVRTWKEANMKPYVDYYLNERASPDLAPIKNS